jgi:hypothetical protein
MGMLWGDVTHLLTGPPICGVEKPISVPRCAEKLRRLPTLISHD